jgi:hypothetical protein
MPEWMKSDHHLALMGHDQRFVIVADAETATTAGSPVIIYPGGMKTVLQVGWEIDAR